jgi:hypothetical protein
VPLRAWRFESSQPHRSRDQVHPRLTVLTAVELARSGTPASAISSRLGVPRATVRDWLSGSVPHSARAGTCGRCHVDHDRDRLAGDYAYVLGLYLGDGCISDHPRGVAKLRIFLDLKYPEIIAEAMARIKAMTGPLDRRATHHLRLAQSGRRTAGRIHRAEAMTNCSLRRSSRPGRGFRASRAPPRPGSPRRDCARRASA